MNFPHPSNEEARNRYENASKNVQWVYTSPESGATMREVFEKHGLPEEKYREYALCVGDVTLGFYKKTQLPDLLQEHLGIDIEKARRIATDLTNLLHDITESAHPPRPVRKASSETSERPRSGIPSQLSKKRTMPADIQTLRKEGRGSAQSTKPPPPTKPEPKKEVGDYGTIPRYAKPLTGAPRYDSDEAPNHKSETPDSAKN